MNYLRIWHDNSGDESKSDWYLKYVLINDLQTKAKFYFICNKWLGLDKEDGLIYRLLPVAGDIQKTNIKYLMEKETKDKMSDSHLWFSIFARPTLSSFNRTDRLTCCFVFMLITGMMNILYYDQDKSPSTSLFRFGPFDISSTQVKIINC